MIWNSTHPYSILSDTSQILEAIISALNHFQGCYTLTKKTIKKTLYKKQVLSSIMVTNKVLKTTALIRL